MNGQASQTPPSVDERDALINELRERMAGLEGTVKALRRELDVARQDIHAAATQTPQPALAKPAGHLKLLDLADGFKLYRSPEGTPLLFKGDRFVGWQLNAERARVLLAGVQEWLSSPAAFLASHKNDPVWKALVEAEQQLKAVRATRDRSYYQVAFKSQVLPGAIWLQPEEGLPLREAEVLLREQQRRRPDCRHWLEPLQQIGQLLRITGPTGTTSIINEIKYPDFATGISESVDLEVEVADTMGRR